MRLPCLGPRTGLAGRVHPPGRGVGARWRGASWQRQSVGRQQLLGGCQETAGRSSPPALAGAQLQAQSPTPQGRCRRWRSLQTAPLLLPLLLLLLLWPLPLQRLGRAEACQHWRAGSGACGA